MNLNLVYNNSYQINAPQEWQGLYVFAQGDDGKSWSWYKNGKPRLGTSPPTWKYTQMGDGTAQDREYPHITISTDRNETGPGNAWRGFHVSFPLSSNTTGYNAHFRYGVDNGRAVFKFTDSKVPPTFVAMVADLDRNLANEIDAFAQAFVTAAWR